MNDKDFDIDADIDAPEEASDAPVHAEKPSLQEIWEGNPALKLVAIAVAGAVAVGGYAAFASKSEDEARSIMRLSGDAVAKQVPGQQDLDPAYRLALEQENKRNAELAQQSGGSAMPTPIGTAKTGGLDVPTMPEKLNTDPLTEWRKATEARQENPGGDAAKAPDKSPLAADDSKRQAVDDVIRNMSPDASGAAPAVAPMLQPVRPQQQIQRVNPKNAQALAEQMRVIIAAQAPPAARQAIFTKKDSEYIEQQKQIAVTKAAYTASAQSAATPNDGAANTQNNQSQEVQKALMIVPAGTIAYVQLLNALNSDVNGPVLAQVLSGPFAGGRAIGKVEVKTGPSDYMVLTFNRIVKDTVSYGINGIAMDEKTTLAGHATDVDHHYFTRIILPAAAKFIEGYGSAAAQTATTTTQTSGGGQATSQPLPSPRQTIFKGIEEASKKASDVISKDADRPVTVKVAKGTTMGLLFIDSVTTKDAGK